MSPMAASEAIEAHGRAHLAGVPSASASPGYVRRQPESTVLYELVNTYVPMLIEEASARSEHGVGYPGFIPEVYERYLRCGLLCHGFVRVQCDHCNFEHLVAV